VPDVEELRLAAALAALVFAVTPLSLLAGAQ